jgi:phage repressor protein C with HTH and peptisase S24 domain
MTEEQRKDDPGARIREARKAKGWTQGQLAEACGWEGASRVGNYESNSREPSRDDWIKIARALEESPGYLEFGEEFFLNQLNEEVVPYGGKEAAMRRRRIQSLIRNVPVIGFAIANPEEDGFYDDMGFAPGAGEEYVPWPTKDSNAYALMVKGDSMQPRIRPGERIVVEPNSSVNPGDDVVVKMRNGRKMVKQLLLRRAGEVTLGSINQAHQQKTISLEEIESMHYVAGIVPRGITPTEDA